MSEIRAVTPNECHALSQRSNQGVTSLMPAKRRHSLVAAATADASLSSSSRASTPYDPMYSGRTQDSQPTASKSSSTASSPVPGGGGGGGRFHVDQRAFVLSTGLDSDVDRVVDAFDDTLPDMTQFPVASSADLGRPLHQSSPVARDNRRS